MLKGINKHLLLILTVFIAFSNFYVISFKANNKYEIDFLSVDNGDAVLITKDAKPLIIIDGGPDYSIDYYLSKFFLFNNCKLVAIFLTHPHSDHLKGLTRILEHCFVENVFENSSNFKSSLYDYWKSFFLLEKGEYLNLLNKNTNYLSSFTSGTIFTLGELKLISLYPTKELQIKLSQNLKEANDITLVLLLDYYSFEVLFMGDLESINHAFIDVELLNSYIDGAIEVVKVPHHGAKNGYNPAFFDKYTFDKAVISTGTNKYGHPDSSVIDYFISRGVQVLRTDETEVIKIFFP